MYLLIHTIAWHRYNLCVYDAVKKQTNKQNKVAKPVRLLSLTEDSIYQKLSSIPSPI